jgi:hypothetical protein
MLLRCESIEPPMSQNGMDRPCSCPKRVSMGASKHGEYIEVRGIGGQHHVAAARLHLHALQPFGMTTDVMDGNAGGDVTDALVKHGAARENLAHHRHHIFDLERRAQRLVAHAAAGSVSHFAVLQMIARLRKQIVIAAMVVMHVADDDGFDGFGGDAERLQTVAHRLDHFTLAFFAHRLVETGVDYDHAGRTDDHLDKEIERLQDVVRIAIDEIGWRPA